MSRHNIEKQPERGAMYIRVPENHGLNIKWVGVDLKQMSTFKLMSYIVQMWYISVMK